ncbi:MAE_28990/MAE_18760 family HEPN-like nuclease [Arcobacter roscoffensis]|uniref:MAE_28990/MAE_18760 family HEPN-like nuclease n=1 Tax=Arcobacter roscoffensis TaxID=2961520 RepID=A0ABY5E2V2_9BACT|nr:MAE_28990/MAE_18760 family HEPN-like nuclease [Arcobacter roscoffensis]UTJ05373.1 MAE_28990/MAE_18760 family HEPN-like nuclease [Arcobacter roscoffensis]
MDFTNYRNDIEYDLDWRLQELRLLKNQIALLKDEEKKIQLRKALLVMLYSHFEGFFKISLLTYIKYINDLKLHCNEIQHKPELITSTMDEIFIKYEDLNIRNKMINKKSREESVESEEGDVKSVDTLFRRTDFITNFDKYMQLVINLKDNVINTESNLKSHVLEKNFYKLSIPHNILKDSNKVINKLVNLRNSIAHGSRKTGFKEDDYQKIETEIIEKVMKPLINILNTEARILVSHSHIYTI